MQVTVTELKTNGWYPTFKTVTVLNKEEFNILSNASPMIANQFKALKNNTYKNSNSAMHMYENPTIESIRAHRIKLLANIGITV